LVPSFIESELRFSSIAEELTTSRVMGFSMSKVPGGGSDVVAVVGAAAHTIGMPAPSGFFPPLLGGRSCSPPLAASTIPGQEEIAARLVLISEREDMPAPSRGVTREKCCRREETRDASGITEASRHKPWDVASSQIRRHNGAQKVLKADANGAEDLVSAACGATLVVGDALAE
jgi:hypothetical protein